MALAGRSALGTEAACLAVSNPKCAEKLSKELVHAQIEIHNHKNIFCAIVNTIINEHCICDPAGKARF
jgi:hypothetical protein